jgi:hypothetical protein
MSTGFAESLTGLAAVSVLYKKPYQSLIPLIMSMLGDSILES